METGFTLDYFVRHMNSLILSVKKQYRVKYNFDSDYALTECSVNEAKRKMLIGINGLPGIKTNYRGLLKFKSNDVPDDFIVEPHIFTACTVGVFHEIGHLNQYDDVLQKDESLAYNDIACYSNLYYWNPRNYAYNPREIKAEQQGILFANDYLSLFFDNSEQMLVDYVNSRVDFNKAGYFIHRNVYSMDDIADAFNDAYLNSEKHRRVFYIYQKGLPNDAVMDFFDEHSEFREKFNVEANPAVQDKMIASVVLCDLPEVQNDYECLVGKDLSVGTVFNIPLQSEHAVIDEKEFKASLNYFRELPFVEDNNVESQDDFDVGE